MSDELKMTLWRSPLPQSEPTPESWQILYKIFELVAIMPLCNCQHILLAYCQHTTSLLPGCTNEVAAKKNSTLANLMSLDHTWSHTHRIIIICRTREFINFVIFTKSSVLFFFFNIPFQFPVAGCQQTSSFQTWIFAAFDT